MKRVFRKKNFLFVILYVVLIVILVNLVLLFAQEANVPTGQTNFQVFFNNLSSFISRFITEFSIISPLKSTTYLFGILLWMILYSVVRQMDLFREFKGLGTGIISLIIVLIIFLGLPPEYEQALDVFILQFGAMGATILAVLPFAIMFYFTAIVTPSLIMAHIIWIIYAFYYFILIGYDWYYRTNPAPNFAYVAAVIAGIIMFSTMSFWRRKFFKEILNTQREKGIRKVQKAKVGADILGEAAEEFGRR